MSQTIGEILKNSREEQNLTIEEAAKQTHLRLHYIKSLEENKLDVFPSKAQGRGFLRIYSDFLNLPTISLLEAWETNQVELPEEVHEELPKIEEIDEDAKIESRNNENSLAAQTDEEDGIDEIDSQSPASELESPTSELKEAKETVENTRPISKKPVQHLAKEPTPSNRIPTPEADSIFYEIGQRLRDQRESLGLSLIDIERYTHIRLQYLQAIEKGEIHKLPSPVQGKGMVDNYAQFLDLDSNAILMRYADGLLTQRSERQQIRTDSKQEKPAKQKKKKTKKRAGIKGFLTPDLLIGSIVIIGLLIFLFWTTTRVIDSRNASMEATVPGISEVLLETSESGTTSTPSPESENQVSAGENAEAPQLEPVSDNTTANTETGARETSAEDINAIDSNPLQIYIVAHQRAYLEVIVDNETVFNGRISPGNAYPFSGADQIEILTGNAAALQVFFNQNDLGTIGTFGQVANIIFTTNGIMTPTPLFTATSTPTTPATVTLQPTQTPQTPTVTPMIP